MSQWVWSGLRWGIRTTRYPARREEAPGVSPGLPVTHPIDRGSQEWARIGVDRLVARCPTGALLPRGDRIDVDPRLCVHCYRCARDGASTMPWDPGYEWAAMTAPRGAVPQGGNPQLRVKHPTTGQLGRPFARSVHIRVIDAGDCGACLHEVKQLTNPYYNLHRLGFFFTPTPRQADILLVVGAGADQMRAALEKTLAAMPTPRTVIAVGACALSGGVFGSSFACSGGVATVVPVDIEVPGNPPPPLAILHALLIATGRAEPAGWAAAPEEAS
jgi:Ni,Fe-hydrogenase III small subunit